MKLKLLLVFIMTVLLLVNATFINAVFDPNEGSGGTLDINCGNIGEKCCDMKIDKNRLPINTTLTYLPGPLSIIEGPVSQLSLDITDNVVYPQIEENFGSDLNQGPFCIAGIPVAITGTPETVVSVIENNCFCKDDKIEALSRLCSNIQKEDEITKCLSCVNNGEGVWTGLGCLYSDVARLIKEKIMVLGLGLAGTTALLCIIYSAIMLQTSQGNPEKIKKAQQLLTSCIIGLVLIIFSIFILRLIGVDILRIPIETKIS